MASATLLQAQADKEPRLRVGLHLAPTDLINLNSRFRLGTHLQLGRVTVIIDAAHSLFIKQRWFPRSNEVGYEYFSIRPEVRYSPPGRAGLSRLYFGLEIPHSENRTTFTRTSFEDTDQLRYAVDGATKVRRKTGLLLKSGYHDTFGKWFYFDFYCGLGAAFRSVRYLDTVNKTRSFEEPTEEWGMSSDNTPAGDRWVPDLSFGVRAGVWLRR